MIDGGDNPGFGGRHDQPQATSKTLPPFSRQAFSGDQVTALADIVVQWTTPGSRMWWSQDTQLLPSLSSDAYPRLRRRGPPITNSSVIRITGQFPCTTTAEGRTLLITFIYTRCPFPDFCPRMRAIIRRNQPPAPRRSRTRPQDSCCSALPLIPRTTRQGSARLRFLLLWQQGLVALHSLGVRGTPCRRPPRPRPLFFCFGLNYQEDPGQKDGASITHSLSTAAFGPDGRIFKWYHGSDWQPADLIKDAAGSLLHAAT